jgi:predicted acetyltransferase
MWEIRSLSADDVDLFRERLARGFGQDGDQDDETARERFQAVFEYERIFAVYDGEDIIGTGGAFSFDLTVPGGREVPMGGTTIITVQPTHRRRGVLRQLMNRHLDEVADRGEPLAGLWASEASIYGRFGYGPATFRHTTKIDAAALGFREPPTDSTRVRLVESGDAAHLLPPIYDAVRRQRPGMLTRTEGWWAHRRLADPESSRGGKSAQRYLICETEGSAAGYAVYRQDARWDDFVADGEVIVSEVIAGDPSSHRAIWFFLTNIDLFPRVSWWNMPVDDPLGASVTDNRRVRRTLADAMWIRVMDVGAGLEARAYEGDGTVTFSVEDATRPQNSGTYRLEVEGGEPRCARTTDRPQLSFDVDVLGHLYLGGGDARVMAAAGRIGGDPDAVSTLHRLFLTDTAPWCPEVF